MSDPRTQAVAAAVVARFAGVRVEMQPNPDPDTASIPEFLLVLDAPAGLLREVEDFALDVAFAAFGAEPLPFLVAAFDPERSARHLRTVSARQAGAA